MQYLKYPIKNMYITQNYNGSYSHKISSTGTPKSYPIDDNCGGSSRDYFYAPCDVTIKRIYGVKVTGTNTIWLESKNKVKLANGKESYVTIMVIHPNDDTLKSFKVGQTFKQGTKMFLEGNDGNATGYHFHIEVATCKFSQLKNNGWVKNSKGAWVISNNPIKPEEAFFVDKNFTKIKKSGGLKFKDMPKINSNPSNTTNSTSYYPKYSGNSNSIVDAMKSLKIDSSFNNREKIAQKNNINNYRGTSEQNIRMLNLLKAGKLIKL